MAKRVKGNYPGGSNAEMLAAMAAMLIEQQAYVQLLAALVVDMRQRMHADDETDVGEYIDARMAQILPIATETFANHMLQAKIDTIRNESDG